MLGVYDVYIGSSWKTGKSDNPSNGAYSFLIEGNSVGRGHKKDRYTGSDRIETKNVNYAVFIGFDKACDNIPANATKITFHFSDFLAYSTFNGDSKAKKWRLPFYKRFQELSSKCSVEVQKHSSDSTYMFGVMHKASELLGHDNPSKTVTAKKQPKQSKKEHVGNYVLYVDGSCNNLTPPHNGGYAFILLDDAGKIIKKESKGTVGTTNNKMEIMAVVMGCKAIENRNANVIVYTDSQYTINVLSRIWKAEKNTELIQKHFEINGTLKIEFRWIRGHTGDKYNEECDRMAGEASKRALTEFKNGYNERLYKEKTSQENTNAAIIPDYTVYATACWDRGMASCAYIIRDANNDIVDRQAYCYGSSEWAASLQIIVDAVHAVPECNVKVLIVSDKKSIYIFTGKWRAKKYFDIINEQLQNERNWDISYSLGCVTDTNIKEVRLLAMRAISYHTQRPVEEEESGISFSNPILEQNIYSVAFKAVAISDNVAKCCYVIRKPMGNMLSNVFNKELDMSDVKSALEILIMTILTEAYKNIPDNALINIYSEDCFSFLAGFYDDSSRDAYKADNDLAMKARYTQTGEKRKVRVLNECQSRLSHAIERKLG